jgi:hypothetical protein
LHEEYQKDPDTEASGELIPGGYLVSSIMGMDIRKHDGIIESDTGRIGVEGFKFQYSWWSSISSFLKMKKYIKKEMV